jgi:hypothetical protein
MHHLPLTVGGAAGRAVDVLGAAADLRLVLELAAVRAVGALERLDRGDAAVVAAVGIAPGDEAARGRVLQRLVLGATGVQRIGAVERLARFVAEVGA